MQSISSAAKVIIGDGARLIVAAAVGNYSPLTKDPFENLPSEFAIQRPVVADIAHGHLTTVGTSGSVLIG